MHSDLEELLVLLSFCELVQPPEFVLLSGKVRNYRKLYAKCYLCLS